MNGTLDKVDIFAAEYLEVPDGGDRDCCGCPSGPGSPGRELIGISDEIGKLFRYAQ